MQGEGVQTPPPPLTRFFVFCFLPCLSEMLVMTIPLHRVWKHPYWKINLFPFFFFEEEKRTIDYCLPVLCIKFTTSPFPQMQSIVVQCCLLGKFNSVVCNDIQWYSAGAIGLPWAFREHDNFSTDIYILDHGNFFETWRQFFPQCLLPFLCKLVMTS